MQEQSRVKKKAIIFTATLAFAALSVFDFLGNRAPFTKKPIGYVVCGCLDYDPDNRLYRIDLETGRVLSISEKLAWMGRPNGIALDAERRRLYVASMRGKSSYDFFAVSFLDIAHGQAQVVKQFVIEVDGNVEKSTRSGISVVYDTLTG